MLSQSEFEMPLSRPALPADPPPAASRAEPAEAEPAVEPAAQAGAAAWTLWGRRTASTANPKRTFG